MMKKRDIAIQLIVTIIVVSFLSILFASFEYSAQGTIRTEVTLQNLIPYLLYLFGISTIPLILGLVIRLDKYATDWLRKNYWVSFLFIFSGIGLCILSIQSLHLVVDEYRMDGMDFEYWHPNYFFSITGSFFAVFGSMYLYLPNSK